MVEGTSGELEVADSVVVFAKKLKEVSPVAVAINTYKTHSLGEYSLDVFPSIPLNERGFYDPDKIVPVFLAIQKAAEATDVKWRSLYNDFEVARQVNQALGFQRVDFQWGHGPTPYVLHIHLDVVPKSLGSKEKK